MLPLKPNISMARSQMNEATNKANIPSPPQNSWQPCPYMISRYIDEKLMYLFAASLLSNTTRTWYNFSIDHHHEISSKCTCYETHFSSKLAQAWLAK